MHKISMLKKETNTMIELREIRKREENIVCTAYIEDCKEPISIVYNISLDKFNVEKLPEGFSWCNQHIAYAERYLRKICTDDILPENKLLMWY